MENDAEDSLFFGTNCSIDQGAHYAGSAGWIGWWRRSLRAVILSAHDPHVPSAYLSPEARTVSELFTLRAERSPDRAAHYEKEGGRWVETSWGEFHRQAGLFYAQAWGLFYFLNNTINPTYKAAFKEYWNNQKRVIPADFKALLGGSYEPLEKDFLEFIKSL